MSFPKEKEKEFPRGGKKPLNKIKAVKKFLNDSKRKNLNKSKDETSETNTLVQTQNIICQPLTYDIITEGMDILGHVYQVYNYHINIHLPNGVVGRVPITHVSKHYNNALERVLENNMHDNVQPLPQMFKVGQPIIVKVLEKSIFSNRRHKIILSLEPEFIQQNWKKDNILPSFCCNASVVSIQEHGYLMDIGVKGLRVFLKNNEATRFQKVWNDNRPLAIGQVLRCLITSYAANVVQLTADPEKVENQFLNTKSVALSTYLPGMLFNGHIKKPLKGGYQIKLTNEFNAFVCDDHTQNSYTQNQTVTARILYILPLVKTIYVSLLPTISPLAPPASPNVFLDKTKTVIVKNISSGIFFTFSSKKTEFKGIVPFSKTGITFPDTENKPLKDLYLEKFPSGTKIIVKILSFKFMENLYIASMEKDVIAEKLTNIASIKIGDIVPCIIENHNQQGCQVTIGTGPKRNLWGFCPRMFMSDNPVFNYENKFPIGKELKGKVLNIDGNNIIVTFRRSLLKLDEEMITNYDQVQVNNSPRSAIIIRSEPIGLLVRFGGDVTGWITIKPSTQNKNKFPVGKMVKCIITHCDSKAKRINARLCEDHTPFLNTNYSETSLKVGEEYRVIVQGKDDTYIYVETRGPEEISGVIPYCHLTDFPDLTDSLAASYSTGDMIDCCCFSIEKKMAIFTAKLTFMKFYSLKTTKANLKKKDDLPLMITDIKKNGIEVTSPHSKILKKFLSFKVIDKEYVKHLVKGQTLMSFVKEVDGDDIQLSVDFHTEERSPYNFSKRIRLLSYYLNEKHRIEQWLISVGGPHAPHLGQLVTGSCLEVKETGAIIQLDKGQLLGLVTPDHMKGINLSPGDKVTGAVITFGVGSGMLELTILPKLMSHLTSNHEIDLSHIVIPRNLMGDIINIQGHYVSVSLRGRFQGKIVYVPIRRHLNESIEDSLKYGCKKWTPGDLVKVTLVQVRSNQIIALFHEDIKLFRRFHQKMYRESLFNEYTYKEEDDENVSESPNKRKRRLEEKNNESNNPKKPRIEVKGPLVSPISELPLMTDEIKIEPCEDDRMIGLRADPFDWEATTASLLLPIKTESDISPMEENNDVNKKLLTATEIEARTRAAEEKLLDPKSQPESVNDFERLVIGSPDSSLCWIKYMTFYIQSAELDAARNIAHRALSTICFREEQEKLNVWLALLNLENLYGTKATLEKALGQALKLNNPYKIHMAMLEIYWISGKTEEADKLSKELSKRYHANKDLWPQLAEFYFKAGQTDKGRLLYDRALEVLDKKDHVNTIVCWAHVENRYGNYEKAQSLLEHVVSTYPKRIDVWSSYIDMLIKHGSIQLARNALERALNQYLPARKKRTLYKKWISLEEQYGTVEKVDYVREMLKEFEEAT